MLDINEVFQTTNKPKKYNTSQAIETLQKTRYGVMARVSTSRQSEEGFSLELQQKLARELAEKNDAIIHDYYIEEGLSASKTEGKNRPELQRLKQDIIDGKVNTVVAYKRDRMFRKAFENMEFLRFLIEYNCELILTASGEPQVDLKNLQGFGQILEYILAVFAQMEAATISTRVSDVQISRALTGNRTGGVLPIGYKYTEDGNFIEPMEEILPVIKMVEDMYLSGVGKGSIAKWMNGGEIKNYPTLPYPIPKPPQNFKKAVSNWNNKNIDTLLFNPTYTGHTSYQSKKNEDMQRIITKSPIIKPIRTLERQKEINDFRKAKVLNRKPPRAYNTPFLLTGLLFCEECGNTFISSTSTQKEKRHSYYKCKTRNHTKDLAEHQCTHSNIYRKEILETMVLQTIKETLNEVLNDDTYVFFEKMSEELKNKENEELLLLDKTIKDKQDEFDNITKIVSKIKDTEMQLSYIQTQAEILKSVNELKEAKEILLEKLETEVEEKYDFEKFLETAKEFGKVIDSSPENVQKLLLEGFIDKIWINANGDVKIELGIEIAKNDSCCPSIPFNTIGHPTGLKNIKGQQSSERLIILNFNDFVEETKDYVRNNFYDFILEKEPKFKVENHHLIEGQEYEKILLTDHPHFKKLKVNKYIMNTLGITSNERSRLSKNKLLKFDTMMKILEKLDSSLDEFNDYILNKHPRAIEIRNAEFLEAVLNNTYKGNFNLSSNTPRHQIFKGKMICGECAGTYTGTPGRTESSSFYKCAIARRGKDSSCNNKASINEKKILDRVINDLNIVNLDVIDKDTVVELSKRINVMVVQNGEIVDVTYNNDIK